MGQINFTEKEVQWFHSVHKGTLYPMTCRVFTSAACNLSTGVPQGSVLTPFPFLLTPIVAGT